MSGNAPNEPCEAPCQGQPRGGAEQEPGSADMAHEPPRRRRRWVRLGHPAVVDIGLRCQHSFLTSLILSISFGVELARGGRTLSRVRRMRKSVDPSWTVHCPIALVNRINGPVHGAA